MRLSWDAYFLRMAELVGSRASCFRAQVGAVIVKDNRVISTGYNGAPRGRKNCLEYGFCIRDKNNIPSGTSLEKCASCGCHAEQNGIIHAALVGSPTKGATMYIAGHDFVCSMCQAAILNAGIERVVIFCRDKKVYNLLPYFHWSTFEDSRSEIKGARLPAVERELSS